MKKNLVLGLSAILGAGLLLAGASAYGQDTIKHPSPANKEIKQGTSEIKQGTKEVGQGTGKVAKGVAKKTKTAAKKAGTATKKAAHNVKNDLKKDTVH